MDVTSIAQACKNNGGKVFVQVERVVSGGCLDPRLVKIPGIYVDGIVLAEPCDHEQCLGMKFNPKFYTGEVRIPLSEDRKSTFKCKKNNCKKKSDYGA